MADKDDGRALSAFSCTRLPDAVELAIELVAAISDPGQPRAATVDTTLHHLRVDQLGRILIALEIEMRFNAIVPDGEVHRWRTVSDIANSLAPIVALQSAAIT